MVIGYGLLVIEANNQHYFNFSGKNFMKSSFQVTPTLAVRVMSFQPESLSYSRELLIVLLAT